MSWPRLPVSVPAIVAAPAHLWERPCLQPIMQFKELCVDAVRYDVFLASLSARERERRLQVKRR